MKTGPIRPTDIPNAKREHIPAKVFAVVNKLIVHNYSNGSAKIRQSDILAKLTTDDQKSSEILEQGWLDFEDAYRDAGWNVEYDKPGYNETYEPTFTFKPKR